MSMKSSATSSSSSTAVGSCSSARSARPGMNAIRVTVSSMTSTSRSRWRSSRATSRARGVPVPHVVGRAPTGRVAVVDEFEPHDPRRRAGLRARSAGAGARRPVRRRPAGDAGRARRAGDRARRRTVGVAADHVVGLRQGAEGGAQRLQVGSPLLAELGSPPALGEQPAGDAVDEAVEDLVDVGAGVRGCRPAASRRRARSSVSATDRVVGTVRGVDPAGRGERTLVGDDRARCGRSTRCAGRVRRCARTMRSSRTRSRDRGGRDSQTATPSGSSCTDDTCIVG